MTATSGAENSSMKMAGVPAFDCGAPSSSKARGRWHARVTDREFAAGVENGRPALTEPAYTNPHIE